MRRPSDRHPLFFAAALGACTLFGASPARPRPAFDASTPLALLEAPEAFGADLGSLLDRLSDEGIVVLVAVEGEGILVVDDPSLNAFARADPEIANARKLSPRTASVEAPPVGLDPAMPILTRWWDDRGTARGASRAAPGASLVESGNEFCGTETAAVTLARRPSASPPAGTEPCSLPWSTHFAAGRCVVTPLYPESTGPASIADWNEADFPAIAAELVRALAWWTLQAPGRLQFILRAGIVAPTEVEPGLLPPFDVDYVGDCMESLGFGGTENPIADTEAFNASIRDQYGAHWAFTQVVINSLRFGGHPTLLGFAYLGGPFAVYLSLNGFLGPDRLDFVMLHEIGHIFQALDEYEGVCGCSDTSGYLDVANGNCFHCPQTQAECPMANLGITAEDLDDLETRVFPCEFTRGMVGLRDDDGDGLFDVIGTWPQTTFTTAVPETVQTSRGLRVEGEAWDEPYTGAPSIYSPPASVNSIHRVEFSIDGRAWAEASPLDFTWSSCREGFETVLPQLGGGRHTLGVRAVNSVDHADPTPAIVEFFVHDVFLRRDLVAEPVEGAVSIEWTVDGEDFGSVYELLRSGVGQEGALVGRVPSRGLENDTFALTDDSAIPGRDTLYRLLADIPGRGWKLLGEVHAVLPISTPPGGNYIFVAPNPIRGPVELTITVPQAARETNGGWVEVRLDVFDVTGRLVRSLGSSPRREFSQFGTTWNTLNDDGVAAPAGVYFLRADLGSFVESKRIVLMR